MIDDDSEWHPQDAWAPKPNPNLKPNPEPTPQLSSTKAVAASFATDTARCPVGHVPVRYFAQVLDYLTPPEVTPCTFSPGLVLATHSQLRPNSRPQLAGTARVSKPFAAAAARDWLWRLAHERGES